MTDLILHVKQKYFEQIKNGTKTKEYRLIKPYWEKRLYNKEYDFVNIQLGYPKSKNINTSLLFPYYGYLIEIIKHEEFGDYPVGVFAIPLVKE